MAIDYLELRPGSCCWFHDDERPYPTDYVRCLECGHCYRDAQELRDEVRKVLDASDVAHRPVPPAGKIHSCPLCAHDF